MPVMIALSMPYIIQRPFVTMNRIPLRDWNLPGCLGLDPGLLFIDPAEVVVILWTFLFMSRERDREREIEIEIERLGEQSRKNRSPTERQKHSGEDRQRRSGRKVHTSGYKPKYS